MEKLFKNKWIGSLLTVICSVLGCVSGFALCAAPVTPANGGAIDTNSATLVGDTRDNSENLILDQIDEKVTKIRPHDVVLDTISRNVSDTKNSTSQEIRHYAIDVIDLTATLDTATTAIAAQVALDTSNNDIFAADQTIICEGISGYKEDHTTVDPDNDLMLYVIGKDSSGKPLCVAVNGVTSGSIVNGVPVIAANTVLTRAGRAGSETQIQTDAYSGVPTDFMQYLQKFMSQIEESTLMKITDKEVDWNFSDIEEEAIYDMKRTQNISFWKGVRSKLRIKNSRSNKAEDVYFTGGIWNQAGKDFDFNGVDPTVATLVSMMKTAFTGNASAKTKLFIAGSDTIEKFESITFNQVVYPGTRKQAFGLEFSSIVSKFGTLLVIHDQTLDDMGMADKGFILDADFLRKWTFGWKVNDFDFKKSGQGDVDGRSLIEICGLVLKNPDAHVRVTL